MAELLCTLCENRWNQSPLELWVCPNCEMAAAVELVLNVTNEEIAEAWRFFNSFPVFDSTRRLLTESHSVYFNPTPRESLSPYLDFLVLAFDKVLIPDLWAYVNDASAARALHYLDSGAILPVDRGTLVRYVNLGRKQGQSDFEWAESVASGFLLGLQPDGTWLGGDQKHLPDHLDPVKDRVLKTGRFINLDQFQNVGDVSPKPLLANLENFIKVLTHLDLKSGKLKLQNVVKHFADHDQYEFEGRPNFFFLVPEMLPNAYADVYAMSRLNHLNAQVAISQLLEAPLLLDQTLSSVLQWKFGSGDQSPTQQTVAALKEFTEALGIVFPRDTDPKDIIKLRDSAAAQEFRAVLARAVRKAQSGSQRAGSMVVEEYHTALSELSSRAARLGDVASISITGSASTLGSLVGGPMGAVVGGLGGSILGYGAKVAIEAFYSVMRKNWAFYFSSWTKR